MACEFRHGHINLAFPSLYDLINFFVTSSLPVNGTHLLVSDLIESRAWNFSLISSLSFSMIEISIVFALVENLNKIVYTSAHKLLQSHNSPMPLIVLFLLRF